MTQPLPPVPYEVRCPIHGSIPFDERERQIIDHPLVQRLRHVSQLGFADRVYPGATHSRFSHSLGVMHLAGRIFDHMVQTAQVFREGLIPIDRQIYLRRVVRLAGLLHDLGHPPFSHSFEALLPSREKIPLPWDWYDVTNKASQATHEDFSVAGIYAMSQENPTLISSEEAQDICALINGRVRPSSSLLGKDDGRPSCYPLLRQIISGEIDADRMDYLRRDAHFAGVTYGFFDLPRLIDSLSCTSRPEGLVMTLERNALYTYENFLMARFHMAMQVYFHKTLLPFEYFLKRAVEEGEIDIPMDGTMKGLLAARETLVFDQLYRSRDRKWASRIIHRRPFVRLLQLDNLTDPGLLSNIQSTVDQLSQQGIEIVRIREERRLSTLGLREAEGTGPLLVHDEVLGQSQYQPLQEVSVLLERYNQTFTIEALYCDSEDYPAGLKALGEVLFPKQGGHEAGH